MWYLDDWHDYVRTLNVLLTLYCLVRLVKAYRIESEGWNTKTRDYWFAFVMWCAAAVVLNSQAIVLDRSFTPAFVFLTAAVLVSAKGLHKFGTWGTSNA